MRGFPAQPGPQRRGLRPLIVQICNCQNRAPPMCATPPFVRWPPIRRHGLDPREAEIVDHVAAVGGRVFLLSLVDLLHDDTEAVMAFDGVLTPESASFAGQAGLSHSPGIPEHPETPPAPISLSGRAGPAACGETGMVGPDSEPLDRGALGSGRNSVSANRPSTCTPLARRAAVPCEAGTARPAPHRVVPGSQPYPM